MKRRLAYLLVLLLCLGSTLYGCSSGSPTDEGEAEGDELPIGDEMFEEAGTDSVPDDALDEFDSAEKSDEEQVENADNQETPPPPAEDGLAEQTPPEETPPTDDFASSTETPPPADTLAPPPALEAPMPPPAPSFAAGSGEYMDYTLHSGDTLMKVAFEVYGDVYQWRKIYESNRDRITDINRISAGTVLKVERPANPVTIDRSGERYLIARGDTLGLISERVYGTKSKWRKLWDNNRQLIRDPNKIYAGFYLYYLQDESTGRNNLVNTAPPAPPPGTPQESLSRAPGNNAAPAAPPADAPAPPAELPPPEG